MKRRSKWVYPFTLKLDPKAVVEKLTTIARAEKQNLDRNQNESSSDVLSLQHERSKRYISFYNTYRDVSKYWINMIEYGGGNPLPPHTSKPCWHHRDR